MTYAGLHLGSRYQGGHNGVELIEGSAAAAASWLSVIPAPDGRVGPGPAYWISRTQVSSTGTSWSGVVATDMKKPARGGLLGAAVTIARSGQNSEELKVLDRLVGLDELLRELVRLLLAHPTGASRFGCDEAVLLKAVNC